jgi:hypothetical protein
MHCVYARPSQRPGPTAACPRQISSPLPANRPRDPACRAARLGAINATTATSSLPDRSAGRPAWRRRAGPSGTPDQDGRTEQPCSRRRRTRGKNVPSDEELINASLPGPGLGASRAGTQEPPGAGAERQGQPHGEYGSRPNRRRACVPTHRHAGDGSRETRGAKIFAAGPPCSACGARRDRCVGRRTRWPPAPAWPRGCVASGRKKDRGRAC